MKTFRYMLIAAALLSVMSIEAHMFDKTWGQKPVVRRLRLPELLWQQ